ncbi:uncharacterized protein LOC131224208 [Magnolia sinica]|uniref:uncharacterized protein LOC131224208 n=1 Tax=Magnolia sinica TaxID=86752 RepID=UPI00265A19C5|nr:uncharacterized protein LOC131224208 [Magnolia sinica]
MVSEWWKGLSVDGYLGFKPFKKLKILKGNIKEWKKEILCKRQSDSLAILEEILAVDLAVKDGLMTAEDWIQRSNLIHTYSSITLEDEISWKQKSWSSWVAEGDKNMKYFHYIANVRARINKIRVLEVDGVRIESQDLIFAEVIEYFRNLLSKDDWVRPKLGNLQFRQIPAEEASGLESQITVAEVKEAIGAFSGDKAPGPNGFPMLFFQSFWEVL